MAATTSDIENATYLRPRPISVEMQCPESPNSTQTHQVDLWHLLELIGSIFQNAAAASKGTGEYADLNNIISKIESFEGMRQVLDDIRSISCEISCNLSAGNVEENTKVLLRRLENYPWTARVVLAVAAFAFSIVELSMFHKLRNADSIAMSVNILKGHSSTTLDFSLFEGIFTALMDVVNTNLDVISISEIPEDTRDVIFPDATYKILRIVLKIAAILIKTQDDTELSGMEEEVRDINIMLQKKLGKKAGIGLPVAPAASENDTVFEEVTGDRFTSRDQLSSSSLRGKITNQIFTQLDRINTKLDKSEKPRPYQYKTEEPARRNGISELMAKIKNLIRIHVPENRRNRHVLLLVSDLDISIEEINVLNSLYLKDDQRNYEIVWLPMDLSTNNNKRFGHLKQLMKWTVVEPSMIEKEVIEWIKREWHFIKNPIAVSVTQEGQVTCKNALPMLWTWGNSAFPFTDKTEQDLLIKKIDEHNGWSLKLLLDEIVDISSWVDSSTTSKQSVTFVCLFGGGDISWIRKFTENVKSAAHRAGVLLKLVYVGKNKCKGIERKELSGDVEVFESEQQWQFWSRVESILYATIRHGKTLTSQKSEEVLKEAKKLVGYGCKGKAWAMFSMGQSAMVTTNGEMALTIMSNYDNWTYDKTGIRFLDGLKNYRGVIAKDVHGCIEVHLPDQGDQIPGIMMCPECPKVMKIFYTYRCCAE